MRLAALLIAAAAGMALAAGCEMPDSTNTTADRTNETPAPDNTAVNVRDREDEAQTPINQDEDQSDVNITAKIRQEVLAREGLSTYAQNVKIITGGNGLVTLRGPVASEAERNTIDEIARKVAGEGKVDNLLEIAASAPDDN
jgi:osmotically-inducible protein OsmY